MVKDFLDGKQPVSAREGSEIDTSRFTPENVKNLFDDLLETLQSAENCHRAVYQEAYDNEDWDIITRESVIIPQIIQWRTALASLCTEITESEAVFDSDFSVVLPVFTNDVVVIADEVVSESVVKEPPQPAANSPESDKAAHFTRNSLQPSILRFVPKPESRPLTFFLLDKEYKVNTWDDLYFKVCEVMLFHQPYLMARMNLEPQFNTEQSTNFTYEKSEVKFNRKQLPNGMWVQTNQNPADIHLSCRRLLEKCGFSSDDLRIDTVEE